MNTEINASHIHHKGIEAHVTTRLVNDRAVVDTRLSYDDGHIWLFSRLEHPTGTWYTPTRRTTLSVHQMTNVVIEPVTDDVVSILLSRGDTKDVVDLSLFGITIDDLERALARYRFDQEAATMEAATTGADHA